MKIIDNKNENLDEDKVMADEYHRIANVYTNKSLVDYFSWKNNWKFFWWQPDFSTETLK